MSSIKELMKKHGLPVTVQAKSFPAFTVIEDMGDNKRGQSQCRIEYSNGEKRIILSDVSTCNDYRKVNK